MTKKPHVHAETIRAWADGESIQYQIAGGGRWVDCADPGWVADYDYRVKPAKQYPTTAAHAKLFANVYEETTFTTHEGRLVEVANFAIRHACDNGQVVTREEFSRAIGDRAARDLAVSMSVRDKCRDLTVKHAMRSGVVHDIERLDLFAIIDAVNG